MTNTEDNSDNKPVRVDPVVDLISYLGKAAMLTLDMSDLKYKDDILYFQLKDAARVLANSGKRRG